MASDSFLQALECQCDTLRTTLRAAHDRAMREAMGETVEETVEQELKERSGTEQYRKSSSQGGRLSVVAPFQEHLQMRQLRDSQRNNTWDASTGSSFSSQPGNRTSLASQSGNRASLASQAGNRTSLASQSGNRTSLASPPGAPATLGMSRGSLDVPGSVTSPRRRPVETMARAAARASVLGGSIGGLPSTVTGGLELTQPVLENAQEHDTNEDESFMTPIGSYGTGANNRDSSLSFGGAEDLSARVSKNSRVRLSDMSLDQKSDGSGCEDNASDIYEGFVVHDCFHQSAAKHKSITMKRGFTQKLGAKSSWGPVISDADDSSEDSLDGYNPSKDRGSWLSAGPPVGPEQSNGSQASWVMSFMKVKKKRRGCVNIMIFPYSSPHIAWEILSLVLVLYDTATVPMEFFNPPETLFREIMTWLVRFFWSFDILVSFSTGYIDGQGKVVMKPTNVAKRYLKKSFHLDFAIVVADWLVLLEANNRFTNLTRNIRLFRVARILRLKKARDIFERLAEYARAEKLVMLASVGRMLFAFLVLLHLLACLWYGIGDLSRKQGRSWVIAYDLIGTSLLHRYLYSFHFAVAIFFGEHTMLPYNDWERAFVVMVLYFSFIMQIWLVSTITTAMTHLEIVSAKRSSMIYALDRYLQAHSISRELEMKVQRNAKHSLKERERSCEEENIELLQYISEPLMMELHTQIYCPTLCIHPIFRCIGLINPTCIRRSCHTAVSVHGFHKGDIVFNFQDTPAFRMRDATDPPCVFFVTEGAFEYTQGGLEDENDATVLIRGTWLAEAVLWTPDWVHVGTLRARSANCRLMALDAEKAIALYGSFQASELRSYANRYVEKLNGRRLSDHTDVGAYDTDLKDEMDKSFPREWSMVQEEYAFENVDLMTGSTAGRQFRSMIRMGGSSVRRTQGRSSVSVMDPEMAYSQSKGAWLKAKLKNIKEALKNNESGSGRMSTSKSCEDLPPLRSAVSVPGVRPSPNSSPRPTMMSRHQSESSRID